MVLLITGLLLPESIMGRAGANLWGAHLPYHFSVYLIAFDCGFNILCVLTAESLGKFADSFGALHSALHQLTSYY